MESTNEPDHKEELLRQAVEAHEKYIRETERLKEERRMAFTRAVYSGVSRRTLEKHIGLAVRTISHIINGK